MKILLKWLMLSQFWPQQGLDVVFHIKFLVMRHVRNFFNMMLNNPYLEINNKSWCTERMRVEKVGTSNRACFDCSLVFNWIHIGSVTRM